MASVTFTQASRAICNQFLKHLKYGIKEAPSWTVAQKYFTAHEQVLKSNDARVYVVQKLIDENSKKRLEVYFKTLQQNKSAAIQSPSHNFLSIKYAAEQRKLHSLCYLVDGSDLNAHSTVDLAHILHQVIQSGDFKLYEKFKKAVGSQKFLEVAKTKIKNQTAVEAAFDQFSNKFRISGKDGYEKIFKDLLKNGSLVTTHLIHAIIKKEDMSSFNSCKAACTDKFMTLAETRIDGGKTAIEVAYDCNIEVFNILLDDGHTVTTSLLKEMISRGDETNYISALKKGRKHNFDVQEVRSDAVDYYLSKLGTDVFLRELFPFFEYKDFKKSGIVLHHFAFYDNIEGAREYVKQAKKVNYPLEKLLNEEGVWDDANWTPMQFAAYFNYVRLLEFFIENHPKITVTIIQGALDRSSTCIFRKQCRNSLSHQIKMLENGSKVPSSAPAAASSDAQSEQVEGSQVNNHSANISSYDKKDSKQDSKSETTFKDTKYDRELRKENTTQIEEEQSTPLAVNILNALLAQKNAEISSKDETITKLSSQILSLNQQKTSDSLRIQTLEKQVQDADLARAAAEDRISSLEKQVETANSERVGFEKRLKDLEETNARVQEIAQKALADRKASEENTEKEKRELYELVASLRKEMRSLISSSPKSNSPVTVAADQSHTAVEPSDEETYHVITIEDQEKPASK